MKEFISYLLFIGSGIGITLCLLICGISIGLIGGTFLSILRYKGIAVRILNKIISIIRGTPLILQLSFIYFSTPGLLGIKLSVITAGIIAFGINSTAYTAEIMRAGIECLSKGQFEAAKTLQIPNFYMWKDIILPQVIRIIFPTIVNEVIALLKETALIATIGGVDIMRKAQMLAAEQFTYFVPLCIAGAYYYVCVILIEFSSKKIEKKWQYIKA
ncbi:MAG: amino acid ABC transporter permease [Coxiellaceae bacterium]|jgi:polar amino acid transport system permease protein|nr:amino acid ABC transporter permease [Coxiellaceae bacterium]